MNFEELLNKSKNVIAPDLEIKNAGDASQSSKDKKSIIEQLKWVDSKTRVGIRLIQIIYSFLILILLCLLLFLANFEIKLGIGFISVAFLLVIFVQQLRYLKYNYLYVSSPITVFLNDAKKRMRVFTPRTWLVIPIWIFIDIGICFIINEIFPFPRYIFLTLMLLQVVLLLAVVLDFYSAYLVWKKEHKPVILEINRMLEEIEN
ncbi:MAG: hypothetical protein HN778_11245 [Prolixibacteraceae bacterium]|jgi:hypothetical protein|nr:hypothetical protein [Prolixibacteraceae bacterium]MBT6006586.1 hypothetical protein [Prolixibacteraceae bacterium]MBT6763609.1 hypothetical protein [Prolixibacteraceae bacterium]MBT7000356.1 hypothetical protein [Prolixibacteraceae bacterium]MBT7395398.1 hypothetical protein [Prolixibacteraceae bacterium]